ncbi:MAG TPA: SGNH/GDSL hydrolase family protein, partial [Candidatus Limnocylindrales bacterium]|nr:SGNH/GDSL hydrolase family protein [Candidatus Limnocylindrales bacterium]
PSAPARVRYVALGDSYTIGTSVDASDRFPDQLVARLAGQVDLELVANLGVNGYTTDDLIADELPELPDLAPDFVTLLIGVNDDVRGSSMDRYRSNLDLILGRILREVPAARIVVVSIPDYTLTPAGGNFGDPVQQSAAIAQANAIMLAAADVRGIAFVDISAAANQAGVDRTLVANDGLHPSGAQYGLWVDLIEPVVIDLLAQAE